MKTTIGGSGFTTRRTCPLCGGATWKTGYLVALVDDAGEKLTRCVCEGCMEDGPEGAALRMRVQAEQLREQAEWLDATAPEVAAITPDDWTTVEQAHAFQRDQDREFELAEARAVLEQDARRNGGPPPGFVAVERDGLPAGFVESDGIPF